MELLLVFMDQTWVAGSAWPLQVIPHTQVWSLWTRWRFSAELPSSLCRYDKFGPQTPCRPVGWPPFTTNVFLNIRVTSEVTMTKSLCATSVAPEDFDGAGWRWSVLRVPAGALHRSPNSSVLSALRVRAQLWWHWCHSGGSAVYGQVSQHTCIPDSVWGSPLSKAYRLLVTKGNENKPVCTITKHSRGNRHVASLSKDFLCVRMDVTDPSVHPLLRETRRTCRPNLEDLCMIRS